MSSVVIGGGVYPARYHTAFDALENWGSSAGGSDFHVSGGLLHSQNWSPDDNHTTAKGGFGRIRLLAWRSPGWDEEIADDIWVCSNFTNALVKAKVRGVNFSLPSGHKVHWLVQARHPTMANKYLNYIYSAVDLSAKLASGNWETIETTFKPDQSCWAWGKGDGIYDTFGSIEDTLRNVTNTHLVVLGPDGSSGPTGAFEMDEYEIIYNRNGPSATSSDGVVVFDPPLDAASTGNNGLSFRGVSSGITAGGTQVRVTFKAPSSGGVSAGHASIGKRTSAYNTVTTPVELKFSGVSGFSIAAGGSLTSDWADLTTATNDVLVTIIDSTSSTQIRTTNAFGAGTHYSLYGPSWNQSNPSGTYEFASQYFGGKIEVKG